MTVLSRGVRAGRRGRRPDWALLTALLVLAIVASSFLVFTSRVELLKFAVILALWAAVVAAFVSVKYRRQSEADQARARDQKLVYDLQLDREISARREYELTVESQLRRELSAELRSQAADEVAALRADLASLRTNLEILFDADLSQRAALETEHTEERTTVHAFSDWARYDEDRSRDEVPVHPDDANSRTVENPIIDVPEVPDGATATPPAWQSQAEPRFEYPEYPDSYLGSHRRAPDDVWPAPYAAPNSTYGTARHNQHPATAPYTAPTTPGERPPAADWQPVTAEGTWSPPGTPDSNWVSDSADYGAAAEDSAVGFSREFDETTPGPRHGRHSGEPEPATEEPVAPEPVWQPHRHARHSATPQSPDNKEMGYGPPPQEFDPIKPASAARHRGAEPETGSPGTEGGGETVADLLARLQPATTGGRRRRRRRRDDE